MKFRSNLWIELVFIGVVTTIVGFLSTRLLTNNEYPELDNPNLGIMLFNYFLIGVLIHFIFEVVGFNESFCKAEFK